MAASSRLLNVKRGAPVDADAVVVERRLRRMLIDRKRQELRQHERRERVHGVLRVGLREEEQPGLPPQRDVRRQPARRVARRGDPELLRELAVVFGVGAADERQRRVVEVGEVVGLPPDVAGGGREVDRLAGAVDEQRRRDDVAVGEALEVARRAQRRRAQRRQVVQARSRRRVRARSSRCRARPTRRPASTASASC